MASRLVVSIGTALLLLSGFGLADDGLRQSEPASGSVVQRPPASVRLRFTQAIEPHRSQFYAYRLESAPRDASALERALAAFSAKVLQGQAPTRLRVDTGAVYGERLATGVQLGLNPKLVPGVYIVVWRIFTASERFESGFISFSYAP